MLHHQIFIFKSFFFIANLTCLTLVSLTCVSHHYIILTGKGLIVLCNNKKSVIPQNISSFSELEESLLFLIFVISVLNED